MVEFCRQCGGSLARGDLTFWMGEVFTSGDYQCPFCNQTANPEEPKVRRPTAEEPTGEQDLVVRDGKAETQSPPPERS